MKPFASGTIIAAWLLRILIIWFVYVNHFMTFADFQLKSFEFYVSAAFIIGAILLVAGGLSAKEGLTVIGGLIIFILPVVQLLKFFPENITETAFNYLIPLTTGFVFFTSGNQH